MGNTRRTFRVCDRCQEIAALARSKLGRACKLSRQCRGVAHALASGWFGLRIRRRLGGNPAPMPRRTQLPVYVSRSIFVSAKPWNSRTTRYARRKDWPASPLAYQASPLDCQKDLHASPLKGERNCHNKAATPPQGGVSHGNRHGRPMAAAMDVPWQTPWVSQVSTKRGP